jgi:uncharacterized protein YjbJ (UPF0337 family)
MAGEKDIIEGQYDQTKGKVKKAGGDLTDDERLHTEGAWDQVKGKAKETIGRAKKSTEKLTDKSRKRDDL